MGDVLDVLTEIETAAEVLALRAKAIEAYAQGRADERAAVVAWLRSISATTLAGTIERGEHVDAGKGKP